MDDYPAEPRFHKVDIEPKLQSPNDNDHGRNRKRAKVVFDDVLAVRWYNTVLGDNPTVSDGPPLSIGWDFTTEKISMNTTHGHENSNADDSNAIIRGNKRRHPGDYYLDAPARVERLRSNGVSEQEIEDALIEIDYIKRLRRANSIRSRISAGVSCMVTADRTPSRGGNEKTETNGLRRTKRGGLLTWAVTPQRSRFSLESPRTTSLAYQQNQRYHAETPFPKLPSFESLPFAWRAPFRAARGAAAPGAPQHQTRKK